MAADDPQSSTSAKEAAERIRALSQINLLIPPLLHSASSALTALTPSAPPPPLETDPLDPENSKPLGSTVAASTADAPTAEHAHQSRFRASVKTYFILLSTLQQDLSHEIDRLEEAGIIPPEPPEHGAIASARKGDSSASNPAAPRSSQSQSQDSSQGVDGAENMAFGSLDVAWLNSRVGGVGKGKEGELVAEARRVLERMVKEGEGNDAMKG